MAKEKPAAPAAKAKKKKMTKTEFYQSVADHTEMKKAEVVKVFDAISAVVNKELSAKGPGEITMPGLFKLSVTRIKAAKGGQKKPNPFKPGEFLITKDKPARTKLKARGLKLFLEGLAGK